MRVLVTDGRDYEDREFAFYVLDKLHAAVLRERRRRSSSTRGHQRG